MNRRSMLNIFAVTVLGLASLAGRADAAKVDQKQLVGDWALVSAGAPNPDIKPFGPNDGFATFQSNGRFSLQLILSSLPKFASNNRAAGTSEENKAVVQGSISYFGTYSVNETDGTVTLHIERCSFPNWNGTDLKRIITSLTREELKYMNPAASVGGAAELAWKRVK
jgi:ABC-type transport system substrate-binding protein